MRNVVVYEPLPLDGVAEDPDVSISEGDAVMDADLVAVIAAQDADILVRRSYEEVGRARPEQHDRSAARSLLAAGAVDELGLVIAPIDRRRRAKVVRRVAHDAARDATERGVTERSLLVDRRVVRQGAFRDRPDPCSLRAGRLTHVDKRIYLGRGPRCDDLGRVQRHRRGAPSRDPRRARGR